MWTRERRQLPGRPADAQPARLGARVPGQCSRHDRTPTGATGGIHRVCRVSLRSDRIVRVGDAVLASSTRGRQAATATCGT